MTIYNLYKNCRVSEIQKIKDFRQKINSGFYSPKTQIKKLQGKKFILKREEKERKNEREIEEIKNNLKKIATKYYELITKISEQVRNLDWSYMENKKLIKDEQDSSHFMLKDPPFYHADDIKKTMETKRKNIVERIEQFLQKTKKEGDALDQLVFRNIEYNEK